MNTSPIRTLLVDDDAAVLTALRHYFAVSDTIQIVGEEENGRAALQRISADPAAIDVVLADIHMPEMGGLELLQNIQHLSHVPAFVAMTSMDTDETMLEILSHGGSGYIIKNSRPQRFIAAVEDAVNGGTAVSPECLSRLLDYIPPVDAAEDGRGSWSKTRATSPAQLTDGEKTVLRLIVQGLSNKEIALKSRYAESTVKKHVSSLMQKFDASSRLKLATAAIRAGW